MADLESLFFYFVIYGIAAMFLSYGIRRNMWVSSALGLIIPLMVGAFRYGVGSDYFSYIYFYDKYKELSMSEIFNGIGNESGYKLIIKFSALFDSMPMYFGLSCGIILVMAYLSFRRDYKELPIGILFFLFFLETYTTSFNIIRQGIAISIVLYASRYIFQRNLKYYCLFMLFAISFHLSAVIFFPAYFFPRNKSIFYWKNLLIIIIMIGITLSISSILGFIGEMQGFERYLSYAEGNDLGANKSIYLYLFLCVLFFYYRKQLYDYDERSKLFLLFSIIGLVLNFTGLYSSFVKRFADYYSVFNILMCGMLLRSIGGLYRQMMSIFIILFFSMKFFIGFYVLKQSNIIPYNIESTYKEKM